MYKLTRIKLVEAHDPIGMFIEGVGDDANIELHVPIGMTLEAQTKIEVVNGKTVNYGDLELNVSAKTSQLPAALTDAGYVIIDGLNASSRSANVFDPVHKILTDEIIGLSANVYDLLNKKPTVNEVVFGLTYSKDETRLARLVDGVGVPSITHVTNVEGPVGQPEPHVYAYAQCAENASQPELYCKPGDHSRYFLLTGRPLTELAPAERNRVDDVDYFVATVGFDKYLISGYHVKWILQKNPDAAIRVAPVKVVDVKPFETMKVSQHSLSCVVTSTRFSEATADQGRRLITLNSSVGQLSAHTANPTPWLLSGELVTGKMICGEWRDYVYVADLNFMCIGSYEYPNEASDHVNGVGDAPSVEYPRSFDPLDERPPYSSDLLATNHFGYRYSDNTEVWQSYKREYFKQMSGIAPSRPMSQNIAQDWSDALIARNRPLWGGTLAGIAYMREHGNLCLARRYPTKSALVYQSGRVRSPNDIRIGSAEAESEYDSLILTYDGELSLLRKDRLTYETANVRSRMIWDFDVDAQGPQYPALGTNQYYVVSFPNGNIIGLRYDEHDDPVEYLEPVFLTTSIDDVNHICALMDFAAYSGITSIDLTEIAYVPPTDGHDNRVVDPSSDPSDNDDTPSTERLFMRVTDAYQYFTQRGQYNSVRKLRDGGYDDHDFIELGPNGEFVHVRPRKWQSVRKFVQLSGLVTGGLLLIGMFVNRDDREDAGEHDEV